MYKVKKILSVLMFVFLLTVTVSILEGCSDSNNEKDSKSVVDKETESIEESNNSNTDDIEVETSSNNLNVDVNSEDYINKYAKYMSDVSDNISLGTEIMGRLSTSANTDPSSVKDGEFLSTTKELVVAMETNYNNLQSLTPPDMFNDYHAVMLGSIEEYRNSSKLFEQGIIEGKTELIDESLAHLEVAVELYKQANVELTKIKQ